MALFDAGSQPQESRITIRHIDAGTTVLDFPKVSWYWGALGIAIGVALLLWQWENILCFLQFDMEGDRAAIRWGGRSLVLGVIIIALGSLTFFAHSRAIVTKSGVSRVCRVFGRDILGRQARFLAIRNIACEQRGTDPVIWIYPTQGDSFAITEFSSAEERDWFAGELNEAWRREATYAEE